MNQATLPNVTPASHLYFIVLCEQSFDWSGQPLFQGGTVEKGYLTPLKQHGLITTNVDEGHTWVQFTAKGAEYAKAHGVSLQRSYF